MEKSHLQVLWENFCYHNALEILEEKQRECVTSSVLGFMNYAKGLEFALECIGKKLNAKNNPKE